MQEQFELVALKGPLSAQYRNRKKQFKKLLISTSVTMKFEKMVFNIQLDVLVILYCILRGKLFFIMACKVGIF